MRTAGASDVGSAAKSSRESFVAQVSRWIDGKKVNIYLGYFDTEKEKEKKVRLVRLKVQNYTDAQYLMFKEKVKEVRRKRQSSRWSGVSWFEGRWRGYGFKRKNGGRAYNRRFPTEMEAAVEAAPVIGYE